MHITLTMEHPLDLVITSIRDVARSFVTQLPFIVIAIVAFGAILLLARLLRALVRRGLRRFEPAVAEMVSRLALVATVILGVFVALWIAIPTLKFGEILASLGVPRLIIGFAHKDIHANFLAGILILWRHPYHVGDQVRSGAHEGTVAEINFRSTVLRTYDGIRVFVPNGKVFTEPLENFTANETRRSLVVLGIDQDASVPEARRVILDELATLEGVLPDPRPLVLFAEVGDFANILHVLYWTAPPTRFSEITTRSLVTERLYEALPPAGITFPYPVQTLQLEPSSIPALADLERAAVRSS
jgi:small-conductance mechanosensitive channel